jgi:hypothetical protein
MLNKFLTKINILVGTVSLSILGNIKLYTENINLKKEKSEMYLIGKNSINEYIRCVNEIKTK